MSRAILFITRNYPPKTGGLEAYSYHLIREFESRATGTSVHKIVLTRSVGHLVWFLPYGFARALYLILRHSIPSVHLCDGLLAPVGLLLKRLTKATVSITIHGLDITYPNNCYQWVVPRCVRRLDTVVCVSRATRDACLGRGITAGRCTVIANGIDPDEFAMGVDQPCARARLGRRLGISIRDKTILFSLGRQVKRKGVAWFVRTVLPRLDETYVYAIAGEGPELGKIGRTISDLRLKNRVMVLGRVSEDDKRLLYNGSDIFIMPNIAVPGDMEGFGIVAIEAGCCGLPVVACNVDGIGDAVLNGRTGYLVEEGDVAGYCRIIEGMALDREKIRLLVRDTYHWRKIGERYRDALSIR